MPIKPFTTEEKAGAKRRAEASPKGVWLIAGTAADEPYPEAEMDAAWLESNRWWACAMSDGAICDRPRRHGGCQHG